uniref:Uncharacterized protein n=1 Tax=Heterosigma akashiwo TaxID=2829 RepID=A0A7S3UYP7_HETAK
MKIYGNLDQDAVVYGTKGKVKIQDELSWFFFQHPELHHEVVGDYEVMDANTVQYKFIKSWVDPDSNEKQNWDSSLPDRNKVERIVFTEEGKIKDVSVTKLCSPVEMGQHFIETRNANNLQGLFELFREDVDAYGHQGRAAAEAAFHAFHEAHPGLAHELQGPFQEVAAPAGGAADAGGAVRYQYLKRWRDPETGEPQQWDAVAKGKAEQLELDGHGRIRRIEIIKLEG